jgi:hypothetical protein
MIKIKEGKYKHPCGITITVKGNMLRIDVLDQFYDFFFHDGKFDGFGVVFPNKDQKKEIIGEYE